MTAASGSGAFAEVQRAPTSRDGATATTKDPDIDNATPKRDAHVTRMATLRPDAMTGMTPG